MNSISCPDCNEIILIWPEDEELDMTELQKKADAHEEQHRLIESAFDN